MEHKVVSDGWYLRFALTCRTVPESYLKPDEELPTYPVRLERGANSFVSRLFCGRDAENVGGLAAKRR